MCNQMFLERVNENLLIEKIYMTSDNAWEGITCIKYLWEFFTWDV